MERSALVNSCIGEYRLVDFLGAGGMGEVYRAVHSKLGRVVAVKVLSSAAKNPTLIERFFNEARIQSSLSHPAIATLYDFLEFNGQPCIIMEYVDGQTLADRIRSIGPLPLAEALRIIRTMAEALAYIHSHGIIHRDIKSNNIKLSSAGQPKLLDFGIARADSLPRLTTTGDVIGTLEYLSPEQLKGGTADARSDIWALGVLLYEMTTGRVPFEATTLGELYEKISRAAYAPPSALNPALPRDVEMIISRCLRKNASDRYQSAQQLLEDVARIASGEAVAHRTPSRSVWVAATGAAAGLLVLVVIGFYLLLPAPPPTNQGSSASRNQRVGTNNQQAPIHNEAGLKAVHIDTAEGPAKVYLNGQEVGLTPYTIKARPGEKVSLVLRRDGFEDKPVELTVGENPRPYTFTLSKSEPK